ncbi:MAG: flagellar hook assembly protein FlgD [Planctomycetota bacterium]
MDGIGALGGSVIDPLPAIASDDRTPALTQDEFFQIMISELANQDPLEPLDNREFLSQLTQMQTLEMTTRLSEGIEAMLMGQQISAAGALIGRQVSGDDGAGGSIEGVVDRVLVQDGRVLLGVGEELLSLANVQQVMAATDGGEE